MPEKQNLDGFWTPRRTWGLLIFGAMTGVVLLLIFDPNQKNFFPICVLNETTGLNCPGCGATRATHALVHGDLATAFDKNPLFILFIPFFAYLAIRSGWPALIHNKWKPVACPTRILTLLTIVVLTYGILRNLSHPALAWMAP